MAARKTRLWVVGGGVAVLLSSAVPGGASFLQGELPVAQAATSSTQTHRSPSPPLKVGELPNRRTQTSITSYNGGTSFTTTLYQGPVNYRDTSGHWQPISNRLVNDAAAGYAYRNQANSFVARFGKSSDSHLLSFSAPGGTWRVELVGARRATGTVNGSTIAYANALPATALSYAVGATGIEETLTLDGPAAASEYDFTLQAPRGLHPAVTQLRDGSWVIRSTGSPEPLFVLDAPSAHDASAAHSTPDGPAHAGLRVSVSDDLVHAAIVVDSSWLHDPARAYPVTVDPTIALQPEAQDGSWAVCTGCTSGNNTTTLWVGSDSNSLYRSAVQFSLGGMPAGATVQSASLGLYYDDSCIAGTGNPQYCNGTSHTIDAHQVTAAWTQSTTEDHMQFNSTILSSATLSSNTLGTPQWLNWDITSLFEGWLAGTTANDGVELLHDPETLGLAGPIFPSQYNTSVSPSYFPKITVTYTTDAVTLLAPTVVHSNGAELNWTPYSSPTGNPFSSNAIYRSLTKNFTPGASTFLTAFDDPAITSYRDTTAAPSHTYYYKMVTNGTSWSPELGVTTPAAGTATLTLQPGVATGKDTWMDYSSSGTICSNYGADPGIWVGSGAGFINRGLIQFDLHSVPQGATINSATLSLYAPYGANGQPNSGTIHTYRVTRAWTEGTGYGNCSGDGATWYETVGGTDWTTPGGDFDPTADGGSTVAGSEGAQWHTFDVAAIAQQWADGTAPNLGILLKADGEPQVSGSMDLPFASDDASDPTRLPTLTMNFSDGSSTTPPTVAVAAPGPGATVSGSSVRLEASVSGVNPITQVQFLVDGASVGTANAAPWQMTWSSTSVSNGTHTITAVATDSAGSSTTSAGVSVMVGNYGLPAVSITNPGSNASLTGTVTVTASATAPSGTSVSRVDLFVDNTRLASLTAAPYSYAWNTLDGTAYDGAHTLTATAYDADGETNTSTAVAVTLVNTSGTQYQATFTQTAAPQTVIYDPNNSNTYSVPMTVTNSSNKTWSSSSIYLCYRWVSLDTASSASADQTVPCAGGIGLKGGKSTTITVTAPSPQLGAGVDQAQYQLWYDLYDNSAKVWFSAQGNQPNVNWVTVNLALKTALGLENYYEYTQNSVGGGMAHMVNVANGDSLLTWTPFDLPGRGLATVVRLTYNSLEDHSDSLAGNNWSLSISSLTRFGLPLDLHTASGNPWIGLVDGDGTYHRFEGATDSSGHVYYVEPPGVHLYLRQYSTTDTTRWWAFTRPDRTTFFYNQNGFPTYVTDRNGNTLSFTVSAIAPSDDPGNLKYHVTSVTDAGGRTVTINYYTHANAPKPKIRGLISSIIDHDGHAIEFSYNDDGNLAQITQRGGTNADGSFLADRSWSFTYTASGDGTTQAQNTASESTKIYSVADPRGNKTIFNYLSSGQDKWKISSETDRGGSQTSFGYNDSSLTTTVSAPLSRTTSYVYDNTGQPTSIQQVLNGTTTLTTGLQWSADLGLTQITDPANHISQSSWDNNGYLTDQIDQDGNHTKLAYQILTVDSNDTNNHWCPSTGLINGYPCAPRTQAHVSQLQTKTDPDGVAAGSGYQWSFGYDSSGNLTSVTDPYQHSSSNQYNSDGTLSQSTDADGNTTKYTGYDANGLATTVVDPLGHTTTLNYDADGLLQWTQDPIHQGSCSTCTSPTQYRTYNYYDSFGRLGLTSQPKSTQFALGVLIFNKTTYDPNNNVVAQSAPYYSTDSSQNTTTVAYDAMDRQTMVTGPDTAADPAGERTKYSYDAAGRLTQVTLPVGVQSGTPNNTHTVNNGYDNLDRQTSQTVYHVDSGGTVHAETTLTCYDSVGNVTSVTQPDAGLSSVSCPAATNTPYTTFYVYDAAHKLTSQTDPDGHQTVTTYDADGNVTAVKDPNGNTATSTYDQLNRLTRTDQPFITGTSPHPATTEYQYDNIGNLLTQISPRAYDASSDKQTFTSYVTTYHYDGDSQLVQTDLPTSSSYPTQYHVLQCYDANGNPTVVSKPVTSTSCSGLSSAQETSTQYLDPGWIYTSQDPGGPVIHYDFNAQDEQTLRAPVTSQGTVDTSKEMTWDYYPDGQIKDRTDSQQQPVSYTYNADNVLLTSHNAAGLTDPSQTYVDTQNTLDDLDRVIRTDEKQQTASNWTFSSYGYDADNNLTDQVLNGQESSPNGTQTKAGRAIHDDFDQAAWLTDQYDCGTTAFSTACPNAQRTLEQFTPTGQESRSELDRSNSSGTWSLQQLNTWDYYANGKVNHATTSNASGATLQSDTVSYLDPSGIYVDGNRTQDTYTLQEPSGSSSPCYPSSCTATYTYDPRDNLVAQNDGHGTTTSYTLDADGNVLTQAQNGTTTQTYTYNGDQIATQTSGGTTLDYWYDSLGRQWCITTAAGSSADCGPSSNSTANSALVADYEYDYLDRLASYRAFSSGSQTDSATYVYDALDRVASETETHPGLSTPRTTQFSYVGLSSQLTEEQLSSSGTTTEVKDYGYDPYGHLLSFTDTPYSNGSPQTPTNYSYGVNVHDSVDLLVNPAGGVKASYGYQPYGQADGSLTQGDTSTTSPLNPMRYEAKRLDSGSQSYNTGVRNYSPGSDHFLTPDVFHGALADLQLSSDLLTQDRYALAGGSPLSYIDWSGHMPANDGSAGGASSPSPVAAGTCGGNGCVMPGQALRCGAFACGISGAERGALEQAQSLDETALAAQQAGGPQQSSCSWNPFDSNSCEFAATGRWVHQHAAGFAVVAAGVLVGGACAYVTAGAALAFCGALGGAAAGAVAGATTCGAGCAAAGALQGALIGGSVGGVAGIAKGLGGAVAGSLARGGAATDAAASAESGALRIYASEGRFAAAERAGALNPGASGNLFATNGQYEFGNIAQSNLAISARGANVAGYWEVPAEYSSNFAYVGRVAPIDLWEGGGREFTWAGSIPFDDLGAFQRIPWAAGQ
jgi:RHS repeat-associated protein